MKTETWCGHDIRFIEINGEWWANLYGNKNDDIVSNDVVKSSSTVYMLALKGR